MMTLNYVDFPNIFDQVIASSDFKTQLILRLTHRAARIKVDRLQCKQQKLVVHQCSSSLIVCYGGPPHKMKSQDNRRRSNRKKNKTPPFPYPSQLLESSIAAGQLVWAWWRSLEVAWRGEKAEWSDTLLYAPGIFCKLEEDIQLHVAAMADAADPSDAKDFPDLANMKVYPGGDYKCSNVAYHSSTSLEIVIENGKHVRHCPFVVGLMKPCVQHLKVVSQDWVSAAAYLHALSAPLHPELKVDVEISVLERGNTIRSDAYLHFHHDVPAIANASVEFSYMALFPPEGVAGIDY